MNASNPSVLDLFHHRYVIGYRPKAEERRAVIASWLAVVGKRTAQKKRGTYGIDFIRAKFPGQNAKQSILENPILLRFPKKKIAILMHSKATIENKERWESEQRSQFSKNWSIHFMPSTMVHNTKSTIQAIQQILEKRNALSVPKTT